MLIKTKRGYYYMPTRMANIKSWKIPSVGKDAVPQHSSFIKPSCVVTRFLDEKLTVFTKTKGNQEPQQLITDFTSTKELFNINTDTRQILQPSLSSNLPFSLLSPSSSLVFPIKAINPSTVE